MCMQNYIGLGILAVIFLFLVVVNFLFPGIIAILFLFVLYRVYKRFWCSDANRITDKG